MKRLVFILVGAALVALVGAEAANAWWQVTAGHCEGHSYGDLWYYGGHGYGCWQYGWEIRTFLWVP